MLAEFKAAHPRHVAGLPAAVAHHLRKDEWYKAVLHNDKSLLTLQRPKSRVSGLASLEAKIAATPEIAGTVAWVVQWIRGAHEAGVSSPQYNHMLAEWNRLKEENPGVRPFCDTSPESCMPMIGLIGVITSHI